MFLRDKTSGSAVPISIGLLEAAAILAETENVPLVRPLTSDLLKNIMVDQFGATVTKAVITELKNDIFYAFLHVEKDGRLTTHDCRPSDAVAMALRFGAPIFVKEPLWTEMLSSEITRKILEEFEELLEQSGQNE